MIRACSERVQVKAGGFGQENGRACASKSGLSEDKSLATELFDGYPFGANLAVVYAKDPSWGFQLNGVSCRRITPEPPKK